MEGLQDIVALLEEQLRPLVQAELGVLVDILYRPHLLFPVATIPALYPAANPNRDPSGIFISRFLYTNLFMYIFFI